MTKGVKLSFSLDDSILEHEVVFKVELGSEVAVVKMSRTVSGNVYVRFADPTYHKTWVELDLEKTRSTKMFRNILQASGLVSENVQ